MGQDQSSICGHPNHSCESDLINSNQLTKAKVPMKTDSNLMNSQKINYLGSNIEKKNKCLQLETEDKIQQQKGKTKQNKENFEQINKKFQVQNKEVAKTHPNKNTTSPNEKQKQLQDPTEQNDLQTDFTESQLNEKNLRTSNPRQEIYCQKEKNISFKHFTINQYSNSLIKKTTENNNKYSFKKQLTGQSQIINDQVKVSAIDQSLEKQVSSDINSLQQEKQKEDELKEDKAQVQEQIKQIKNIIESYESAEKKSKMSEQKLSTYKKQRKNNNKPENRFIHNSTYENDAKAACNQESNEKSIKNANYYQSNKIATKVTQKQEQQSLQSKINSKIKISQSSLVNKQANSKIVQENQIDNYDKKLKEIQYKYEKNHQEQHLKFQSQLDILNQLSSVSFLKSRQAQNQIQHEVESQEQHEDKTQQSILKKQNTDLKGENKKSCQKTVKQFGSSTKNQRSASVKSFQAYKQTINKKQNAKKEIYTVNQILANQNQAVKEFSKPDLNEIQFFQSKQEETIINDREFLSKETGKLVQLEETYLPVQKAKTVYQQQQNHYQFPKTQPNAKSEQKNGINKFSDKKKSQAQQNKIQINKLINIKSNESESQNENQIEFMNEDYNQNNEFKTKAEILEKRKEFLDKKKKELGFSTGKTSKPNLNLIKLVQDTDNNEINDYKQDNESAQKFSRPIMMNVNEVSQPESEEIIETDTNKDSQALTDFFQEKKKSFMEKQLKKSGEPHIAQLQEYNTENKMQMKPYGKSLLRHQNEQDDIQQDQTAPEKQNNIIDRLTNGMKPKALHILIQWVFRLIKKK